MAIIAGAGRGIGAGVASTLAAAGARVAAVDVDGRRAAEVCEEIVGAGGVAQPVVADLRESADIERIAAETLDTFGAIDILVNVAGGMFAFHPFRKLVEWTDEVWDDIVERNLRYVFRMCRAVIPTMVHRGQGGIIINIVSISGTRSAPLHAAYGAAKGGLVNLNRSLAIEHGADGIRVNGVAPGAILTPATEQALTPDQLDLYRSIIPLGRAGRPRDIAGAVLFLASDLAAYLTGQTLIVDGGATITYPMPVPVDDPGPPRG